MDGRRKSKAQEFTVVGFDPKRELTVQAMHGGPHPVQTNGVMYGSQGRIRADEMDMAVLNLGAGPVPMQGQHVQVQMQQQGTYLRPVINLEYDSNSIPKDAVRPDLNRGQLSVNPKHSNYVQGDANDVAGIRTLTGFSSFDQIHAVNPYGFDPLRTALLLAPGGLMVVTGQNTNPFATQRDLTHMKGQKLSGMAQKFEQTNGPITSNPSTVGLDLKHRTSTGTIDPLHSSLGNQSTSQQHGGHGLDSKRSSSATFIKKQ